MFLNSPTLVVYQSSKFRTRYEIRENTDNYYINIAYLFFIRITILSHRK